MRNVLISDQQKQQIVKLRDQGKSFYRIAKLLGISLTTTIKYGEAPRNFNPDEIEAMAKRCPGCGRKIVMPCAACALENQDDNHE